jgi:hypothetical protein
MADGVARYAPTLSCLGLLVRRSTSLARASGPTDLTAHLPEWPQMTTVELRPGETLLHPAGVPHALRALEESHWVEFKGTAQAIWGARRGHHVSLRGSSLARDRGAGVGGLVAVAVGGCCEGECDRKPVGCRQPPSLARLPSRSSSRMVSM